MNLLNYVSKITGINNNYFTSSIESILVLFILRLSDKVFQFINNKFNKNDKNKYKLNKRIHLITNIIIIIAFVIIWQDYFKNFLTLISFVSAALTFALRDIILISEEHNGDNFIELELRVSYDPWIVYHVNYDTQKDRLESYITLR